MGAVGERGSNDVHGAVLSCCPHPLRRRRPHRAVRPRVADAAVRLGDATGEAGVKRRAVGVVPLHGGGAQQPRDGVWVRAPRKRFEVGTDRREEGRPACVGAVQVGHRRHVHGELRGVVDNLQQLVRNEHLQPEARRLATGRVARGDLGAGHRRVGRGARRCLHARMCGVRRGLRSVFYEVSLEVRWAVIIILFECMIN